MAWQFLSSSGAEAILVAPRERLCLGVRSWVKNGTQAP
jgi:hypothetical protein